ANVFLDKVPEHHTLTHTSGAFKLCTPSRTAGLRVEAEGYGPWMKAIIARGSQRQDIVLMPRASLTGTVVMSRGGAPVPGSLVTVRSRGELVRAVQADEAGQFEIAGMAPGTYTVEARAEAAKSHHPVDVAVFAATSARVTVPLDDRARVSGRVLRDNVPVAGATVNIGFASTSQWGTAVRTG